MDTAFYTARQGAITQQECLNVISNNLANVNTYGYKAKTSVFMDLMYYNMRAADDEETRLKAGSGVRQVHTNTNFAEEGRAHTAGKHDFAIEGEGFFMLRDAVTNEVTYTRAGNFSTSLRADGFYLVTDSGKLVLDQNQNPIRVIDDEIQADPGVYTFVNMNGMESVGSTEFTPVAKNGNPMLIPNAKLINGYIEMSNVNPADEISKTIKSSRAYSYALKMVQTSDEVEQTINSLRS